ncbi:unnamed protein product [Arctia plantaginis]|uniref:Uncharacterized protein n=1 Tax=Arctia plantaginis TaxID=874455 RepID=A0A8S0ZF09_ARCPL|nr:unnamed protein product [Arctia plantaginis]
MFAARPTMEGRAATLVLLSAYRFKVANSLKLYPPPPPVISTTLWMGYSGSIKTLSSIFQRFDFVFSKPLSPLQCNRPPPSSAPATPAPAAATLIPNPPPHDRTPTLIFN